MSSDFVTISATSNRARDTFLLEVALDEARTRQRIADALLRERAKRGGGDARRFPQPKMADLLGVSMRTYQHWEAAEVMPRWGNLEEIADRLNINVSDLIGDDDDGTTPDAPTASETVVRNDRLDRIEAQLAELHGLVAQLVAGQPARAARQRSA